MRKKTKHLMKFTYTHVPRSVGHEDLENVYNLSFFVLCLSDRPSISKIHKFLIYFYIIQIQNNNYEVDH